MWKGSDGRKGELTGVREFGGEDMFLVCRHLHSRSGNTVIQTASTISNLRDGKAHFNV